MWPTVEYDFAALLHIDLEDARRQRKSLRWLSARITGLLNDERSGLHRLFAPEGADS